jgi:hypothetical protein
MVGMHSSPHSLLHKSGFFGPPCTGNPETAKILFFISFLPFCQAIFNRRQKIILRRNRCSGFRSLTNSDDYSATAMA